MVLSNHQIYLHNTKSMKKRNCFRCSNIIRISHCSDLFDGRFLYTETTKNMKSSRHFSVLFSPFSSWTHGVVYHKTFFFSFWNQIVTPRNLLWIGGGRKKIIKGIKGLELTVESNSFACWNRAHNIKWTDWHQQWTLTIIIFHSQQKRMDFRCGYWIYDMSWHTKHLVLSPVLCRIWFFSSRE